MSLDCGQIIGIYKKTCNLSIFYGENLLENVTKNYKMSTILPVLLPV